jgi:LysM repeat protein
MNPITHLKAHELLQKNADHPLTEQELSKLQKHLKECQACRAYAKELEELQDNLRLIAPNRLNRQDINLPAQTIIAASQRSIQRRNTIVSVAKISTIPALAVILVMMLYMFGASPIISDNDLATGSPLAAPIPTPIFETVTSHPTTSTCINPIYIVKNEDTLESIALKFAIRPEEIQAYNHLANNVMTPHMSLIIPSCGGTPNKKTITPKFTTTITPAFQITPPITNKAMQTRTENSPGQY